MSDEQETNHTERALQLLRAVKTDDLAQFLSTLHPVELASLIQAVDNREEQIALIQHITGLDTLAEFVAYADQSIQQLAIELIDDMRIAAIARRVEIDDAADIIGLLPRRRQVRILKRLSPKDAKEVSRLLAYNEDTAGGLMTTKFLTGAPHRTAQELLQELQQHLQRQEISPETDITYIYVTDIGGVLLGVVSLRELLSAESSTLVGDLMHVQLVTVAPEDDQEKVARIIADYDFSALPVVDSASGQMSGLITLDDVLDVLEEEHTEDLLKLAGTEDQDIVGATRLIAFRSRMPWLLVTWAGGLLGSLFLDIFSSTLERVVALAFFMPVVFGMAGNVGTQSLTITVRGLATGTLLPGRILRLLLKEASVGLLLGALFGLLLAGACFLLYHDQNLSMVVGTSITVTMTSAAVLGTFFPIFFTRLGVDPAIASGPLVTTVTDILSIVIYFTVATLLI